MYVGSMSDNGNEELVRKTIRYPKSLSNRIFMVMQNKHFITESEVIRRALNIGITTLEKKDVGES